MTVSLSQVLASARARSAPLAGECAGYLVLAAADHAAQGPRRIEAGSVELHPDGSVRVVGGMPADEATTERDLRDLLDELLLVAGSVTPALLRSARRRTGVGIDGFVREIETALIPVNRAAARRALSRLERETTRAVERGGLVVENQRVSDRALAPEAPPPAVSPVMRSETPPKASLTPPPVSAPEPPSVRQPPVSALQTAPLPPPSSRPATDLLPTPVAVPVRPRIMLEPLLDETPSKLETRPETVLARSSSRPPQKPSFRLSAPAKPERPLVASPEPGPVSVSPCAPPPVESMTPFLGTAVAQRVFAPAVAPVPQEVEEDDIVEESADEFTEPFYLDGDAPEDVGLAFHELTALTGSVGPVAEPVIELAESPAPVPEVANVPDVVASEVSAEMAAAAQAVVEDAAIVAVEEVAVEEVAVEEVAVEEVAVEEVAVEEVAVEVAAIEDIAIEDIAIEDDVAAGPDAVEEAVAAEPALDEVAPPVAPPRGEFDDVELAVMLPSAEPPPVMMRRPATDPASLLPRRPLPQKRTSNVDDLLQSFGHGASESVEGDDVRSSLKRLAGLELTPPPPGETPR